MSEAERDRLLVELGRQVVQLSGDRDDMVVGITVAVLDLYRAQFTAGFDSKDAALARLRTQRDDLANSLQDDRATRYLQVLIDSLESDRLDAAKLLRDPAAGSA